MKELPVSERLIFRELEYADADAWAEFMASAEALTFLQRPVGGKAEAIAWIERQQKRYADFGIGLWAIIDKQANELVGCVGLLVQEIDGQKELEIGYHLIPRFWKKGYATEAAQACKEFALKHNLADSLISIIHTENYASQAVALRNGMTKEKQTTFIDLPVYIYRTFNS